MRCFQDSPNVSKSLPVGKQIVPVSQASGLHCGIMAHCWRAIPFWCVMTSVLLLIIQVQWVTFPCALEQIQGCHWGADNIEQSYKFLLVILPTPVRALSISAECLLATCTATGRVALARSQKSLLSFEFPNRGFQVHSRKIMLES